MSKIIKLKEGNKNLTNKGIKAHSEPSQTSKMEIVRKKLTVQSCSLFSQKTSS